MNDGKMLMVSTLWKGYLKYIVFCLFVTLFAFYMSMYNTVFDLSDLAQGVTANIRMDNKIPPKMEHFFVDKYILLENSIAMKGHFNASASIRSEYLQIDGLSNFINPVRPLLLPDEKMRGVVRRKDDHFKDKRMVTDVDCRALVKGSKDKENNETDWYETKIPIGPEDYMNMTKNCTEFIQQRGYIMHHLTQVEQDFPLAFSVLMYRDVEQTERLLRAIYRPQNIYCVHVDSKSSDEIYNAMLNIINCFDNVFMPSKRLDIKWGRLSVLTAELQCMSELWNRGKTWKYFINLTGQEFPLRTNYELVRILQAYKGANDVQATVDRADKYRWTWAGHPPHNITAVKGAVHVVVQRGFVDYVLHDSRAKDILNWAKKTFVPDETFFAVLNHNPLLNVPGSYNGLPETTLSSDPAKPFMARFKNWGSKLSDWPCEGKRVHGICVFGTGDLPLLASRKELFANKFHLDYQPRALDCMEELLYNNSRDEYRGTRGFDVRWYSGLGFVKNKVN